MVFATFKCDYAEFFSFFRTFASITNPIKKMKLLIQNATIINEGKQYAGSVLIQDEVIQEIYTATVPQEIASTADRTIDATGLYLIPGVIDDHVHFRDPGITHKADMATESNAAAAGGVTSIMDMPNVQPLTTTLENLEEKFRLGAEKCRVNYSFFFGATNNNAALLPLLDKRRVCGVKLFMGSSTGNMLVDRREALLEVFRQSPMLIMAHCEDSAIINSNLNQCRKQYGDDPSVEHHPEIRSEEACYRSSELAVSLAQQTGARLHIAHISTARELQLLSDTPLCADYHSAPQKKITGEACVAHLVYTQDDYAALGTRIKCNPAIKSSADRAALRQALTDNRIDLVGTDHAPHLLSEKAGGCVKAVSGMPMVQFSLCSMLQLAKQGILSLERVVHLMCHAPAALFEIERRGYIRKGYFADLVLLRSDSPWVVTPECIRSKCGWSPLEGQTFDWRIETTFCNGHAVYDKGEIDEQYRGKALTFDRQ